MSFPQPEGYVEFKNNQYLYTYQYKDHLGNIRLTYRDGYRNHPTLEYPKDSVIQVSEIIEENNYYPFGLQHKGYNELPGDGYKYKFLNKEYEDSFALNVTETDYRQYDAALGRFNVMDALSEMAPDHTPYRYGFNNPVFWQDATGLFESWTDAREYQLSNGLLGSSIGYDWDNDYWYIEDKGSTIQQVGNQILKTYEMDGEWIMDYSSARGGSGGGGSSNSNLSASNNSKSNNNSGFWKFWEVGGMFQVWGVMRDDPGFKPNSRKRSSVDVSMNYDEAYQRGKTSMMAGANWWKRYKDFLGGLDSRNSTLGGRLNQTETETKDSEVNSMDSLYPQETRWFGIGVVVYPKIDSNRVNISPNSERGQAINTNNNHYRKYHNEYMRDSAIYKKSK